MKIERDIKQGDVYKFNDKFWVVKSYDSKKDLVKFYHIPPMEASSLSFFELLSINCDAR